MPTMKMRDVKVGEAIMYNGEVWVIFDRHEQTRGNLRTYWQIKLKHLERGSVVEQRFSPDDNVEKVVLYKEEYQYLGYRDGDMFVVMHPKSYEQINVPVKMIPEAQHGLMVPNMTLTLLSIETKVIQCELPQTVEVEVTDAPDAARMEKARALAGQNRCNFCHQSNFEGGQNVPRLAGQREDYLLKALRGYKDNSRRGYDAFMAEVVYPLQDADLVELAYFLARVK